MKRPGISNHALRHTAATLGYLHTGDLRAVQEFLGHADPRQTSRYAHVVDMAKRNPALFIRRSARHLIVARKRVMGVDMTHVPPIIPQ